MEQKLEDFEYLYNLFRENYPFLEVNKRLNGVDWLANKEMYIDNPSTSPTPPAFEARIIVPNEVAYLHISEMSGISKEKDGKEMRKFYEEIKNYKKLIIDIRGNSGGSDDY